MSLPAPHKVGAGLIGLGLTVNLVGGAFGLRTICMVLRERLDLDQPAGRRRAAAGVAAVGAGFFWHLLNPMTWRIR